MEKKQTVVFVCEHGAAKSVLAAAYFNRFAAQMGLDMQAVARGTKPDQELSPQTVKGLAADGLTPTEEVPQKLTVTDTESAQRVVAFCDLPAEFHRRAMIERWEDIPAVSEDYEKSRDVIIDRIRQMLNAPELH